MLREIRDTYLAHMQYSTLEVESNILGVEKLRGKAHRNKGKGRSETLLVPLFPPSNR